MNTSHNIIQIIIHVYNYLSKAREWFRFGLHELTSTCHIKNLGKTKIGKGCDIY